MTQSFSSAARRIITPAPFTPVNLPAPPGDTRAPLPWRAMLVMLTLALLALALLLLLPRWTPSPLIAQSAGKAVNTVASAAPGVAVPADDQVTAAARRTAQVLLRAVLARLAALEARKAESWDRSGLHHLTQALNDGEKAYSEQRFRAAQDAYRTALIHAADIEARLPGVIASLLKSGDAALEQGNSAAADAAFAQVLAIAPTQRAASLGRARAATLDRVRALVEQAEAYEQMGDADKAREVYNDAHRLDAHMASVAAGLARLDAGARVQKLKAALSDGHRALARDDYSAAREAFKRAAALDGQAEEVTAGLRETNRRATAAAIASALELAGRARREEAWPRAAQAYGTALALDAELDDAAQGKQQASLRAALDAELEALRQDVLALAAGAPREAAQRALARAQTIAQPGPRLRTQMAALSQALREAREPLTVTLQSDDANEVEVEGVGALGRFKERQVTLTPGRHAAVVHRDGAAPLRIEFDIAPGARAPRVILKSAP